MNEAIRNIPVSADHDVDYRRRVEATAVPVAVRIVGHRVYYKVERHAGAASYNVDQAPLVARFRRLAKQWIDETVNMSLLEDMILHPAYQEIIGMGPSAIPLLLDELEREPNHWFAALHAVSGGQNPIADEDAGDTDKMIDAWIDWAKENSYR